MRIEIEIPKEFEGDYDADRFGDFFERAMIDIETMQGMCGRYEIETAEMLQKAFAESKVACNLETIQEQIHNAGGCDGTTDYDKGWDDAIREAERIVKEAIKG